MLWLGLFIALVAVIVSVVYDRRPSDVKADSIMFHRQPFDVNVSLPALGRFFLVDLPANISSGPPGRRHPMVFLLHGAGSSPDDEKTLLGAAFLQRCWAAGWLVVYPAGVPDPWGSKTWNAGACCGYATAQLTDDLVYFEAVIGHVRDQYHGDPHAIAIHGLSNGAFMAHRLACHLAGRPDVTVRAIAPYNGALGFSRRDRCKGPRRRFLGLPVPFAFRWDRAACPYEDWAKDQTAFTCPQPLNTPILAMNNGRDIFIGHEGVIIDISLGSVMVDHLTVPPADYVARFYATANGCGADPPEVSYLRDLGQGDVTECRSYRRCAANTTFCLERESGHAWTTTEEIVPPILGLYWVVGPFSRSFDPTSQTWEFFAQHLP
eukprot:EG_transcript_14669